MNNKNFVTYIDYGLYKIRSTSIKRNNSNDFFFHESDNVHNDLNKDVEIEKIIANIEKDTNEYLEAINLMIDSSEMHSIALSLSKNFDGSVLKKEDVKFLIQDAKQQILRNHINQNILHIIVRKYKIDNIEYSYLPDDIRCSLLSIDIIFICLPKKITEQVKKNFLKYDISINQTLCSSYIKSLSYKNEFNSSENLCFIDIGFDKTSIIFYIKNEMNFFHVLPLGSNSITLDLSKVLNIDLSNAEIAKLYSNDDDHFFNEKNLSIDLVKQIIFFRIEEILKLALKSVRLNIDIKQFSQFTMILMGKGSMILDKKLRESLSLMCKSYLINETKESIGECVIKLNRGLNKQEVVLVPKKQTKRGFFERLFHFFN